MMMYCNSIVFLKIWYQWPLYLPLTTYYGLEISLNGWFNKILRNIWTKNARVSILISHCYTYKLVKNTYIIQFNTQEIASWTFVLDFDHSIWIFKSTNFWKNFTMTKSWQICGLKCMSKFHNTNFWYVEVEKWHVENQMFLPWYHTIKICTSLWPVIMGWKSIKFPKIKVNWKKYQRIYGLKMQE